MKKLILAILLLVCASPAHAQFSRITSITLTNNNNTQAAFYASPFTVKAGANCTWSIAGTVATFNCSGGGGATPGGATGTIQYNAGSGAFGGINNSEGNKADCDGMGDPCQMYFVNPAMTFQYLMFGTFAGGPTGNFFDMYQDSGGGIILDGSDGTTNSGVWILPDGLQLFTGNTVVNMDPTHNSVQTSRLYFKATNIVSGDFAVSSSWGNTAAVSFGGASTDNNPNFIVTSDGTGTGANPTVTFTYHQGAFSAGGAVPTAVCKQSGGSGAIADTTESTSTTALTLTWHATPAGGGATYNFSCFIFQGQQ